MLATLSQVPTTVTNAGGTITSDEAAVLLLLLALGVVAMLAVLVAVVSTGR